VSLCASLENGAKIFIPDAPAIWRGPVYVVREHKYPK
jgi:hypothetical protein